MPYTFTLTTTIPASPEEIYQAWLDSVGHSEMTGGAASMSDEIGAEVSAWDGYISGRNIELVPGERIVQSWRTTEFTDEYEDSVITVVLQEVEEGTLLTLVHSNVPDHQTSYQEGGWEQNYFEPMVAYFAERNEATASAPAAKATPKTAPKTAAKMPPKTAAKRAAKTPRGVRGAAARTKSKRSAPRAKASAGKRKSKGQAKTRRAVIAASARKRAKPAKRKSGRGRRR